MNQKKGLIVLMGTKVSYSVVQSSRALYIFQEIKKRCPETYLIIKKNEQTEILLDNLIQIKPKISILGEFTLLKGILFILQMTINTFHVVVSKKIDYVVLRGYDTILLFVGLKLLNIKIYYDFHGKYDLELHHQKRFLRAFIVKWIEKIILRYSDRIIVISKGIEAQIEEYQNKCIYLPNGIDLNGLNRSEEYLPIELPINKKIIGFIGNWEPIMKIEDVCDSINYLNDSIAVIVGRGYKFERILQQYCSNMNIIFTGQIEQKYVYSILKKMDVCVVPYDANSYASKIKNFFSNRKIYEYLAAGKPIIISKIEGVPEFLEENTNYLPYESGNAKDLADKIKILYNNQELYHKMSESNAKLATTFQWSLLIKNSGIIEDIKLNK